MVLAPICLTVGFWVVTFGTLAQRTVITFVSGIAMTLLVLEPRPVNTPRFGTRGLRVRGNVISVRSLRFLAKVVERIGISAALAVPTAVVGARCSATALTCERWEAFALASGAITQAMSATLAVRMLVVECGILRVLQLVAVCGVFAISGKVRPLERGSRWCVNPVFNDV